MNWKEKIIDYIRSNQVCATEVADCLNKTGALEGVYALNQGNFCVGNIKWVVADHNSNWNVHNMIRDTQEHDIVFIDAINCENRAIIGELVSKYILEYRKADGIICNTYFRDATAIIREKWPIWGTGFNPVGCFNKRPKERIEETDWYKTHKSLYDGAVAVCDDCGVVIIPKDKLTEDLYIRLVAIEEQESIWFDRLMNYNESTLEIVCEKNYLNDSDYMNKRRGSR